MTPGSSFSPVTANLYMEAFDIKAVDLAPALTKMLIRYVDDTFVLLPHGEKEFWTFQDHLNSIKHSI